jgi:hypothetical protein
LIPTLFGGAEFPGPIETATPFLPVAVGSFQRSTWNMHVASGTNALSGSPTDAASPRTPDVLALNAFLDLRPTSSLRDSLALAQRAESQRDAADAGALPPAQQMSEAGPLLAETQAEDPEIYSWPQSMVQLSLLPGQAAHGAADLASAYHPESSGDRAAQVKKTNRDKQADLLNDLVATISIPAICALSLHRGRRAAFAKTSRGM